MLTTRKPTVADGKAWRDDALAAGAGLHVGGGIVRVSITFEPGDVAAYCAAEELAHDLIAQVPTTAAGSVWGTTSDGVGGLSALKDGRMVLKASGVSKRFVSGAAS
jgi:hypothetical protein